MQILFLIFWMKKLAAVPCNRLVEGCDATVLTYGQTGSGKTHTMTGLRNCFEETGIVPRFFAEMFELQRKGGMQSCIVYKMSYVELIEPADVKDLLVKACDKKIGKLKYQDRLKVQNFKMLRLRLNANSCMFQWKNRNKSGIILYCLATKLLSSSITRLPKTEYIMLLCFVTMIQPLLMLVEFIATSDSVRNWCTEAAFLRRRSTQNPKSGTVSRREPFSHCTHGLHRNNVID